MNPKSEMYGTVYMIRFLVDENLDMRALEIVLSFDEATERSKKIIEV